MPRSESIHDEPQRRNDREVETSDLDRRARATVDDLGLEEDDEDAALAEVERLIAERDDMAPSEDGEMPPELEEQLAEAKRDLDAEEPDALARHALEAAVGNDE